MWLIEPLQYKKGQKNLETREKSKKRKKTAFFSVTPNVFGTAYFEAALANPISVISDFVPSGEFFYNWYYPKPKT